MMKPLKLLPILLLIIPLTAFAETTLTLTFEDTDSFPYTMKDGSGIDMILLKMVDDAMPEVSFKYIQTPWKRCLDNIQSGIAEACFTASYKEERKVHGYYPGTHTGGDPDPNLRLHSTSYSLYVLKDSSIEVTDTLTISGLKGQIAAPAGYSIGGDLEEKGYKVDAGARRTANNFEKLLAGHIDAVAALSLNGDNILAKNTKYSDKIRAIETQLVNKPYYLMFSKQFVDGNKALAEKIWAKIAEIRETQAFKDQAGEYLSK